MNVHISYKLRRTPDIDHEIQHWTEKIQKRLQVFRPELVHLKGLLDKNTARAGAVVSLNLRLPSGQMAVQESADTPAAAIKAAFADLLGQVGRHKELLRNSHRWRRRNGEDGRLAGSVPFERTIAAVLPITATSDDVRAFMNANFVRLGRYVEREIYFRESGAEFYRGAIDVAEVVDEVAARALDDSIEKSDRIGLEAWLYRLAIQVMEEFASGLAQPDSELNLQSVRWQRKERGSDEPRMQFHQPDETMTAESSIADTRAATPEEIAYTDEIVKLIHFALRDVVAADREAFILHALEGFSPEEIASITDKTPGAVHQSIARARAKLRYLFPSNEPLKKKMSQPTGAR
ncbi:MAG TPA: sigma-70 family RNA polymerase sigma factor [Terriglobales bacterium]|jgi:RNA polymerase sigma factor (sigma-70 family)